MPGKPLSGLERRARQKRSLKKISSAVEAGGLINLGKASDETVDIIARSKTSTQRGAAKQERLKRTFRE